MADLHALLRRQLRKFFGSVEIPEPLRALIETVNETYVQADDERRMMERAFELSSQEMLDANGELATAMEALGRAAEQAAEANRAKDEFLAMLGHELRNPLAPIVTSLDVAKVKGVSAIDARDIERPVRQVLRLVDDLLDIARVARGSLVLERRPLELSLAVRNAVEAIRPAAEQSRHLLEVEVPGAGLTVDGDEVRLTQVVSNLLMNAVRYTPPGGHVSVAAWRDVDHVVLSVRDNGRGIDAEELPHIFDSFAPTRSASARPRAGLGLGLTIVRNMVELHGGTVTAQSSGPGAGATFEVRLPRLVAGMPKEPAVAGGPAPRLGGCKILIVDDNREAADLIGHVLQLCGHDVALAYSAGEALVCLERFVPDVALLDVGLPDMNGLELGRQLHHRLPSLKLIAVTGYGQPSDRDASTRAGFAAHLVKPVAVDRLLEVLAKLDAGTPVTPSI